MKRKGHTRTRGRGDVGDRPDHRRRRQLNALERRRRRAKVGVANTTLGRIIVDGKGRTL
jgi:hypothetical protein